MSALVAVATQGLVAPQQATSDAHLIELWLHGRSAHTQRAYRADVESFLSSAGKDLRSITLGDLHAWQDSLADLLPASQARKLSSVKSLFTFAHELGYLAVNVGVPVKLPSIKQALAERILSEGAVHRMVAFEASPRDRVMLRLLYLAGLRISEVCGLRVRDLQENKDTGQVTVFGKGGKTRVVLLPTSIWQDLRTLCAGIEPNAPVFRSRKSARALDPSAVHRVVKTAAKRAGLSDEVSAHWLRHAHVSHALDRGAPAHLVQSTVGHASLSTTSRYAHARPGDSSARYLAD